MDGAKAFQRNNYIWTMKKPLFDEFQRMVIRDDNTLMAAQFKMDMAIKKFKREFINTRVGRLLQWLVERCDHCFSKK